MYLWQMKLMKIVINDFWNLWKIKSMTNVLWKTYLWQTYYELCYCDNPPSSNAILSPYLKGLNKFYKWGEKWHITMVQDYITRKINHIFRKYNIMLSIMFTCVQITANKCKNQPGKKFWHFLKQNYSTIC